MNRYITKETDGWVIHYKNARLGPYKSLVIAKMILRRLK